MNYKALEGLIKSILTGYSCEFCKSHITTEDIFIKSIQGNSVILEIPCPKCKHKGMIKSEVITVDITKYLTPTQMATLKDTIEKKHQDQITDMQIMELNKTLKKENFNVKDLFSEK